MTLSNLPTDNDYKALLETNLFPKIAAGKAILFLGAGASVTTTYKFLSRQIIEMYSTAESINLETDDIVEFVDILERNVSFDRAKFDKFVLELLDKLTPTEAHKIITQIPWREIITTNFDTLIEQAIDQIKKDGQQNFNIEVIRDANRANYTPANDEFRYVKLNGCASSRDAYPFVFSTKDFDRVSPFYNKVLTKLKHLSPDILFISIGHSYLDPFGKYLLEKFDQKARVGRRQIYNVDPFVPEARLAYYKEKNVLVIPRTTEEFFHEYNHWIQEQDENIVQKKRIKYFNPQEGNVTIPAYLARKLGDSLKPLTKSHYIEHIEPKEFYLGIEPSFGVITKDLDVIRKDFQAESIKQIKRIIKDDKIQVPTFFLKGTFGAGKTTSLYRLVSGLLDEADLEAIAFEAVEPSRIRETDLRNLFEKISPKTVFIIVEKIETDSSYRSLKQLQSRLMSEQFSNLKPIILTSIRENIFAKYKSNSSLTESFELTLDEHFSEEQINDLLLKLENANLINFPDARSRQQKVSEIVELGETDLLVILLNVVEDGKHRQILRSCYQQLPDTAKEVLLYTSLLNQHRIDMPVGLLRSLLKVDWDDVGKKILQIDFKGFVNQTKNNKTGTEPDLYLNIRHRRIAEEFVQILLPVKEQRVTYYQTIINNLQPNSESAILLIDLLKNLRITEELNRSHIDKLYDYAANKFDLEPHFITHYSMNLTRRGTFDSLYKAKELVSYAMSKLGILQNHRLIHRRAAIAYRIAKKLYDKEPERTPEMDESIYEATMFFRRKILLDPESYFSYLEYLEFEIWQLNSFQEGTEIEMHRRLKIERLFRQADSLVKEGIEKIQKLKVHYYGQFTHSPQKIREYTDFLDEMERHTSSRPLALALKYYFYQLQNETSKQLALISELEPLHQNEDIAFIIFNYYGENLYIPDIRVKFHSFINKHPEIKKTNEVLYHFYSLIINAYDKRFRDSRQHAEVLKEKYFGGNIKMNQVWRESQTGKPVIFESVVEKFRNRYRVEVFDLRQHFPIMFSLDKQINAGDYVTVELNFNKFGTQARLIDIVKTHDENESGSKRNLKTIK